LTYNDSQVYTFYCENDWKREWNNTLMMKRKGRKKRKKIWRR